MEVLLNKTSATEATLNIKIAAADYRPKMDKTVKDYAKKANLKGFRPGKVPPQVIERMYGKSILVDEVNDVLSKTLTDYIRDNKLQIVGDPELDQTQAESIDWATQKDFEFNYNLGMASDFEVELAKMPAVSQYTILAGEAELNETIDNLKEQFSEQIQVEVSEAGDMIYGELKQGEFSTKTAIPFEKIKEEAKATFVGVAKGGSVSFDIRNTFVDDNSVKLLTGLKEEEANALEGEFTLDVEDITRRTPGQMNQEFFDKVLGKDTAADEEDFKTKVLEIIQGNYAREAGMLLNRDMEEMLLREIKIDLPSEFLKSWLLRANQGQVTAEDIEKDFATFEKATRMSLIKNRIAEQAEIKVDPSEIIQRAENMVRSQFGMYMSQDDDKMNEVIKKIAMNYLTEEGKTDNYSKLFTEVQDDKINAHLSSSLTLEAKDISVEEFKEIVKALAG